MGVLGIPANENMPEDIRQAREYLETGGLGEVFAFAWSAWDGSAPKVQSDTSMAIAMAVMAGERLDAMRQEPVAWIYEARELKRVRGMNHGVWLNRVSMTQPTASSTIRNIRPLVGRI